MWTEEMRRWVNLCKQIDYLYDKKEITDVMEGLDKWKKDLEEIEKQKDILFESFTDEQKEIIFQC